MAVKGQSMSITVQSLPYELITEISSYLSYTDTQSFRVTAKLFNTVLESIALSHLTLSWTCREESDTDFAPFPLEKILAYIKPGRTRGFQFVRHLRIERVCGYLESRHCPLDGWLNIKESDFEAEPKVAGLTAWNVVEKRNNFVWYLLRRLITGEALENLKTITINTDVTHCSSQVGHDPSEPPVIISKLLSERQHPVQTFRFNIHSSYLDASSTSILGQRPSPPYIHIPPCNELYIRGLHGSDYVKGPLPLIEEVLNSSPYLEGLDIDAPWDEERIKGFFPSPRPLPGFSNDGNTLITRRPTTRIAQLRRLRLLYTGFTFESHQLSHLQGLHRLEVHTLVSGSIDPSASSAVRRSTCSVLWPQFRNHKIFVRELCIAFDEMENNVLEYLKAHPPGKLKSLTIYSRTKYRPVGGCERGLKDTPKRFYAEVLPHIALSLDNLVIDTDVVDDWCLGRLDEAVESLRGCTSLRSLHVTVDPQCELERRNELLKKALVGLHNLRSVTVAEARFGFGRLNDINIRDLM